MAGGPAERFAADEGPSTWGTRSRAPKTSGVAQDLTFKVRKEEKDRLLIDSRRQQGWISKSDAIPFDQAVAHFRKELDSNPKHSHALTARGLALSSGKDPDKAFADFDSAIEGGLAGGALLGDLRRGGPRGRFVGITSPLHYYYPAACP